MRERFQDSRDVLWSLEVGKDYDYAFESGGGIRGALREGRKDWKGV